MLCKEAVAYKWCEDQSVALLSVHHGGCAAASDRKAITTGLMKTELIAYAGQLEKGKYTDSAACS